MLFTVTAEVFVYRGERNEFQNRWLRQPLHLHVTVIKIARFFIAPLVLVVLAQFMVQLADDAVIPPASHITFIVDSASVSDQEGWTLVPPHVRELDLSDIRAG